MQKDTRTELERFLHSFTDFFRAYRALFSLFYDEEYIAEFLPFVSSLSLEHIAAESAAGFPYVMPYAFSSSPCTVGALTENMRGPVFEESPVVLRDGTAAYIKRGRHIFIMPQEEKGIRGEIRTRGKSLPLPSPGPNRTYDVTDEECACFLRYLYGVFPVHACIQQLPRILMELFLLIEETADLATMGEIMEGIGLMSEKQVGAKARIQNMMKKKTVQSRQGYDSAQYIITASGVQDIIKYFTDYAHVFIPVGIRIPENLATLCEDAFKEVSATYGYRSKRGRSLHDIREARIHARLLLSPAGYGTELMHISMEDSAAADPSRPGFRRRHHGNTAGVYADISETMSLTRTGMSDPPGEGNAKCLRRRFTRRTLAYEIDNGTEQLELTPDSRNRQKALDERQRRLELEFNGKRAYAGDNAADESSTISGKVRNYARIFSKDGSQGDVIFLMFETAEETAAVPLPSPGKTRSGKSSANSVPSAPDIRKDPPAISAAASSENWKALPSDTLLRGYYLAAGGFAAQNFQDGFPDAGMIASISCAELLRYLTQISNTLDALLLSDGTTAGTVIPDFDAKTCRGIRSMRLILSDYLQYYGGDTFQDKSRKPLSDFFSFLKERSLDGPRPADGKAPGYSGTAAKPGKGGLSPRSRTTNMLKVLMNGSASAEIRLALFNGMSVSAVFPSRICELFFVTPERWFGKRGILSALRNLGLLDGADVENRGPLLSYHTPLITDRGEAGTTTRLCLWNENIRVAVENISADIGGFIRARNYLASFPAGSGKRTVMLMLVSDSLVLADGSSLLDGTMLRGPENRGIRYGSTCRPAEDGTPAAEMNYYFEAAGRNVGQLSESVCDILGGGSKERFFHCVPFLRGIDRDYVMVTYSDFMKAVLGERVQPYTIFSGKKVFVREGYFNENRLPEPYRTPAGTTRIHDHDMSALLIPAG